MSSRNEIVVCENADDGTYAVALPTAAEKPSREFNDPRFPPTWTVYVTGTFDSATVDIDVSGDGGTTYTTLTNADDLAAATVVNASFRATHVRAVISGSVTAASITVRML